MATDTHPGHERPTFVIENKVQVDLDMITQHGLWARFRRARKCACVTAVSSANIRCQLCRGDGWLYDFQRRLIEADEDSDVRSATGAEFCNYVLPFRIPMIEPLYVRRLLPEEQGGIKEYKVERYDAETIEISGEPLPRIYEKMQVGYIYDRYNKVEGESPLVFPDIRLIKTRKTKVDEAHRAGNAVNVHGDIATVERLVDTETGFVYRDFETYANEIYLRASDPKPTPGKIVIDYHYVPPAKVIVTDLEHTRALEGNTHQLETGSIRLAVEPWFDLPDGTLVTLLVPVFRKNEILEFPSSGNVQLSETDVFEINEKIIDSDGAEYINEVDFVLISRRILRFVGRKPAPRKKISVLYGYHPTLLIRRQQEMPNNLENKSFARIVFAEVWTGRKSKGPPDTSNNDGKPVYRNLQPQISESPYGHS